LSDGAKFCSNCGKPQTGNAPQSISYEYCEIGIEIIKDDGFITDGQIRWVARKIGTKHNNIIRESPVFDAHVRKGTVKSIPEVPAMQYLENLINRLQADKWEYVGKTGDFYWHQKYRRRIG
jgi:hypothetical protein